MRHNSVIIDTTLREGEQSPGVYFSPEVKRHIIDGLVRIGVTEVELGISSPFHPCAGLLIAYCRDQHPHLRLSLWSRCREEDITMAAELRPDLLSLSIPVSEIHLEKRLGKNRAWAMDTMSAAMHCAAKLGIPFAIGFEDASRSDIGFLTEMAMAAERLGAERIRLADTLGIASPGTMTGLIRQLGEKLTTCPVAVHTHNDFGMATANAVAALEAGARFVDTVVLGLGERTGCARLEEVVGYLALVKGESRWQVEMLKPLAEYVAEFTGKAIAGNRPIVGDAIFTCETGLHLQGLRNDPQTYEPFAPERVGARRSLLLGPKSGRRAILAHLEELDERLVENPPEEAVQKIREVTRRLRRPLHDHELRRLLSAAEKSYSNRKES
ncbi:MAG: pyruvate carboxyltransferase [Desulforhopalus sp.]|nr:pyruvate carboxyltransferase [Desulforhopalus sp.]